MTGSMTSDDPDSRTAGSATPTLAAIPLATMALDHVGLVGGDMAAMRNAYIALGFAPTEPKALMARDPVTGTQRSLHQESCHLVFQSGYVELSALGHAPPTHHLASYAGRYDGLHILALASGALAGLHDHLTAAGLAVSPLRFAARDITYGERHGSAQFEWFMLDPAASPDSLLCFVHHLTPELVFQTAVQRHPNTACRLLGVTYLTADLASSASVFARLADAPLSPHPLAHALLPAAPRELNFALYPGLVRLCTPDAFMARYPGCRIEPPPRMAAMTVGVRDLEQVRAHCAAAGIPLDTDGHRVWVDAPHAAGAIVEFCPCA
jgi:hypothetical protein